MQLIVFPEAAQVGVPLVYPNVQLLAGSLGKRQRARCTVSGHKSSLRQSAAGSVH